MIASGCFWLSGFVGYVVTDNDVFGEIINVYYKFNIAIGEVFR